jgi:hypothetical protein
MRMKPHLRARLPLAAVTLLTAMAAHSQQTAAVSEKNAGAKTATEKPAAASATMRRMPDGHPDLSGTWAYGIGLPPGAVKKVLNGQVTISKLDQSARQPPHGDVPGALPWTPAPSYKPEFQQKVKYLAANESKQDSVFYCGKPGVPRIGAPRKIVQLPNEMIFLYEDISGDPYRVIPTDGRPHRKDANPSYYGDAVSHWQGDTLVVESTNFVDDTWFGEEGYFHSGNMRVIERLWLTAENKLAYQVTVDDPGVLTQPWTNYVRVSAPSNDLLEESPPCKDDDGPRLVNSDHHIQR